MKNNKFVLPIIIIFLLFFLPLSIYGIYSNKNSILSIDNPNHEHKYNNKLYYYDDNDNLIGYYECLSEDCDDAKTIIEDENNIYYDRGTNENIGLLSNNNVFISDNNIIKLYNLNSKVSILELKLIKNYNTTIDGNLLIVKNTEDKYGVMDLNLVNYKIMPEYDYLAINNSFDGEKIIASKLIAKKDDIYYLIDINNKKITADFNNNIYDYNDNIVVCSNDNKYMIYKYDGTKLLDYQEIIKINILKNEIIFQNRLGNIYIYDNELNNIIKSYVPITSDMNYTYDVIDNGIEIKNNNVLYDTYLIK